MDRSTSYSLALPMGVAMMVASLAGLAGRWRLLLWIVFVVGAWLAVMPFWLDWRYGKYRPDVEEYNRMTAAESRKGMRDVKFRRHVEHLFRHEKRTRSFPDGKG
jgi:hypothetical protein